MPPATPPASEPLIDYFLENLCQLQFVFANEQLKEILGEVWIRCDMFGTFTDLAACSCNRSVRRSRCEMPSALSLASIKGSQGLAQHTAVIIRTPIGG